MKKVTKYFAVATIALIGTFMANAQSRTGLRINEVMVANENSIIDDFGEKHAWIELFNSNFSPLEISSVYLTNDSSQKTLYPVPLGDVNTEIPTRQHVVFFADGEPNKGTFHTSFVLVPGQENWIGIYDADGKTLIDEVTIPADLAVNQTWARTEDGTGQWAVRDGSESSYITPSSANVIKDTNDKIANFSRMDENGFGMTIMAMCIVFSALLILCLCFYGIGKVNESVSKLNKMRAHGVTREEAEAHLASHDSGEEIAAIVMALNQHLNAHDTENTILTIKKMKRAYSPWSSKIYGLREIPNHNPARK